MMLLGRKIFEKFGWRVAALITPSVIGSTGLMFFLLNIFAPAFVPLAALLGTTPLILAVIVGAVQNILSNSSKYSLFDPCKEMAFIPLDKESKTKGKAVVEVIANPLGKSGGSIIQQLLLFATGSLTRSTPVSIFAWTVVLLFKIILNCLISYPLNNLFQFTVSCRDSCCLSLLVV